MELNKIPVNIWDDYYDDGYVPKGEVQKTYVYVEEPEISNDDEKKYLKYILTYIEINKLLSSNVVMYLAKRNGKVFDNIVFADRWEINFIHFTHKEREKLLKNLQDANLSYDGIPFKFYSES